MIIYVIAFLIMIAIAVGIIFLLYWLPKKLGYAKMGKYLAICVSLFFIIMILMSVFEDELFSKNDARKLLREQNIELKDDFIIVENESMSSIGDYYHTFTLTISEKDKTRIIGEIMHSKNFNSSNGTKPYFDDRKDYYNGPKRIKNYETGDQFIRELFEPLGEGYAPTWRKIEIMKTENKLMFEDIDE